MNGWTQGVRTFAEELGIIQSQDRCIDKRGVEHHANIKDGILYHNIKSSRPVKGSWIFTESRQISNTKVIGNPLIFINEDGDVEIWAIKATGGKIRLWAPPETFPDPAAPKPP